MQVGEIPNEPDSLNVNVPVGIPVPVTTAVQVVVVFGGASGKQDTVVFDGVMPVAFELIVVVVEVDVVESDVGAGFTVRMPDVYVIA
jgi:hypothetical protein